MGPQIGDIVIYSVFMEIAESFGNLHGEAPGPFTENFYWVPLVPYTVDQ